MMEQSNNCKESLSLEISKTNGNPLGNEHDQYNHDKPKTCLQLLHKRRGIIIRSFLVIFSLVLIGMYFSFRSHKTVFTCEQIPRLHNYRSDIGTVLNTQQANNGFGYPLQLIEDLVRDRQISFVFPVHAGDAGLLVNLLRSIRNLCADCAHVPVIIITDDASKKAIYEILHNNKTTPYPKEPTMAQSFSELSVKLLRDVMPYYTANRWNDDSLLVNGKFLIQSHKKMFGVLNGATTRFSWVMDVDSFVFKPMSLAKVLKTYLSSPYIFTANDWSPGRAIFECIENLTRSFLTTGYTLEIMHWIYDKEIVSDFNNVVISQYPTWNVPMLFHKPYFFEVAYYHFIMSNQILSRKYMQYRIVEIRTLLGGNYSPLLQAVVRFASGGMIERISNSISNIPSIYNDVVQIWKKFQIPVFRPESSELVSLDFALDTDVVIMTNSFKDGLYRMSQSGYWNDPEGALKNADKHGWKPLADHLKNRINKTGFSH